MNRRFSLFSGLIIMFCFCSACSKNESSFTQMPGFKKHFEQYKPSTSPPSAADQALLEKYKPRVFLQKGQTPLIDFYANARV